jgi:hypothetical protein
MNHNPLGWIRSSPKSGLHVNGSSQLSAATSMPCASNFALARQPLGGFRFGALHAYRVWRAVRRPSAFGAKGRYFTMRDLGAEPVRSRPGLRTPRAPNRPSPAGGPLGRNGGGLGPGSRHPYSVINEQTRPGGSSLPSRLAAGQAGRLRRIRRDPPNRRLPATEDRRGPAGLSRSLQNWEIIPETRGCKTVRRVVCGPI